MNRVTDDFCVEMVSCLSQRKRVRVMRYALSREVMSGMSVPEEYRVISSAYETIKMPSGGVGRSLM